MCLGLGWSVWTWYWDRLWIMLVYEPLVTTSLSVRAGGLGMTLEKEVVGVGYLIVKRPDWWIGNGETAFVYGGHVWERNAQAMHVSSKRQLYCEI